MRLPIIKNVLDFIESNDEDYIHETIQVLESLAENPRLKDEELDVIGELLSNLYGGIEVQNSIKNGAEKKTALNEFMKRVSNSID